MPNIIKKESIVKSIQTSDGELEVTINLNLTISIENGELNIKTQSNIENVNEYSNDLPNLIPDDHFDDNIVLNNFGQ